MDQPLDHLCLHRSLLIQTPNFKEPFLNVRLESFSFLFKFFYLDPKCINLEVVLGKGLCQQRLVVQQTQVYLQCNTTCLQSLLIFLKSSQILIIQKAILKKRNAGSTKDQEMWKIGNFETRYHKKNLLNLAETWDLLLAKYSPDTISTLPWSLEKTKGLR